MNRHHLGREIKLALFAKLAGLALIYAAFFSAPHKTVVTPSSMAQALFDAPLSSTPRTSPERETR